MTQIECNTEQIQKACKNALRKKNLRKETATKSLQNRKINFQFTLFEFPIILISNGQIFGRIGLILMPRREFGYSFASLLSLV
jgi:hypothetical protein